MNEQYEEAVLAVVRAWLEDRASGGSLRTIHYITRNDIYPTIPTKIPAAKVVKVTVEFVPEDETRPC